MRTKHIGGSTGSRHPGALPVYVLHFTWLGPFALDEWLASVGTFWASGGQAALSLTFAVVALLLASVGLYAVLAHTVGRRTNEIGVRLAVGGAPSDILALVYREGMRDVVLGLGLGVGMSLLLPRLLGAVLLARATIDVTASAVAVGVLLAAGSLACLIPARLATRVDPVTALREG